jgi:hypothetical protein
MMNGVLKMRKHILALMALLSLAAIGLMNATAISPDSESLSAGDVSDTLLRTMQAADANDTAGQSELNIWNSFVQNLNHQIMLLQGNKTNDEIMIALTTLFVLNSHEVVDAQSRIPDEKYKDFHNATVNGMKYFNIYLYNMAKAFETRDMRYFAVGREAYNKTMEYYNMGKIERDFLY